MAFLSQTLNIEATTIGEMGLSHIAKVKTIRQNKQFLFSIEQRSTKILLWRKQENDDTFWSRHL